MPTPGDDDDIIIHRVQNADGVTDTETPVATTRALFHSLLGYVNVNGITNGAVRDLYNQLAALST
jgi:hypothetical protein